MSLFPRFLTGAPAVGMLVLRLVTGIAFLLHGWPKIHNPAEWMGVGAMPGYLQAAAAYIEFGGGITILLGLLTPVACLALGGVMPVGIFQVHVPQGHAFVGPPGKSYELAADYLAIVVALLLAGPGALSVDALLFGRQRSGKIDNS